MILALADIKSVEIVILYGAALPNPLVWPNGDISYAAVLGDEREGYRVVSVEYAPDAPNEFYHIAGTSAELKAERLIVTRVWEPNDLDTVKVTLAARVDDLAEQERLKYITQGFGQALVYSQKLSEAQAALASGVFDKDKYKLLDASKEGGDDLAAAAARVVSAAGVWTDAAAVIEKVRLGAKASIRSAATVNDAYAASQIEFPVSK